MNLRLSVAISSLRSEVAVSRLLLRRLLLLLLLLLLSLRLAISVLVTRLVVVWLLLLLVVTLLAGALLLVRCDCLRLLDDRRCRSGLLGLLLLLLRSRLLVVLLGQGLLSLGLAILTVSLEGVVSRRGTVSRLLGGGYGRRSHLRRLNRLGGRLLLSNNSRLARSGNSLSLFALLLLYNGFWLLLYWSLLGRFGLPGEEKRQERRC